MDYCMGAYGAKNSDCQIKNSPIPTESQLAIFNASQIFLLYGIALLVMCVEHNFLNSACACTNIHVQKKTTLNSLFSLPTSWYYYCVLMDSHPVNFTSCGVFAKVWLCSVPPD